MPSDSSKTTGNGSQRKSSTRQCSVSDPVEGDWANTFGVFGDDVFVEDPRIPVVDSADKTTRRKPHHSSSKKKKKRRKSATTMSTSVKVKQIGAVINGAGTLQEEQTTANCSPEKETLVSSRKALHRAMEDDGKSISKVRHPRKKVGHMKGRGAILDAHPGVEFVSGEEGQARQDYVVRLKDPRPPLTRKTRHSSRRKRVASRTGTSSTNTYASEFSLRRMKAKAQQLSRECMVSESSEESIQNKSTEEDDEITTPLAQAIGQDRDEEEETNKERSCTAPESSGPLLEDHLHESANSFVDRLLADAQALDYDKVRDSFDDLDYEGSDNGLASVVIPVEGEVFYDATAVEYDPDSKPPLHRNRRFQLYTISIILFLVIMVVGAVVGIAASKGGLATYAPTLAPSSAPSTRAESEYSRQFIQAVGDAVEMPGTPAYRAADWIISNDPMNLPPNAPNLVQRFILVNFYFATSQSNHGWRSCGAPQADDGDTCVFQDLVRLPDDTQAYDLRTATRWLSSKHECKWVGIQCDELRETAAVEVWGQNLTGTVPTCLAALGLLQSVSLAHNDLSGQIPTELASMRHLVNLELQGNQLTGPIPNELWDVTTLQLLNVGENRLSGTLSPDVAKLRDLKGLHLFQNQFTGPFPVNVPANLNFLAYMRIDNNQFTGTFHTEFGELTLLNELWYHNNSFDGTIPSEVGVMRSMTDLRVLGNELRGTIPEEVYFLTDLFRLEISKMRGITGTISTRIGSLQKLERLGLQMNTLTGTVPSELGLCTSLLLVWLHLNELSGSMPPSVCQNRRKSGSGKLEILQADCLSNPPVPPPFECDSDCCTACCARDDFNPVCKLTEQPE